METFADPEALSTVAAGIVAGALSPPGPKTLIVTGGRSPGAVYDRLSQTDLDWASVAVTLSDDRWVDETSPNSNAALVRRRLLTGRAASARFLPLKGRGASPEADALAAEPALAAIPRATATVLGMGEDGHIASLFPADPDLAARLDPDGGRLCVGVPVAGLEPFVPRISLTLRALLATEVVVLLISGAAKRALVERVAADGAYAPPVAALLRQHQVPVRVLWTA